MLNPVCPGIQTICFLLLASLTWLMGGVCHAEDEHRSLAEKGRVIFERENWYPRSPAFNARSCAHCHKLRGVGGAGEEPFNARSIAIERLQIPSRTTTARLRNFLRQIHPDFVDSSGTMATVIPLPHFGGPARSGMLRSRFSPQRNVTGTLSLGPADHHELVSELMTLPEYVEAVPRNQIAVTLKSFQRNTPALFGLGLIDQITDQQITQIARRQARELGISGRPATLSTGGIGRFGWRANVATLAEFTRQACVNELGITVQAEPRPAPAMAPQIAGSMSRFNVSLEELQQLATFIGTLPAPEREMPDDFNLLWEVSRGEELFKSIGCSICHLPSIGEVKGIYSDLLLHDMGPDLRGASTADPYIRDYREGVSNPTFVRLPVSSYYGQSVSLPTTSPNGISGNQVVNRYKKTFQQPYAAPQGRFQFVVLDTIEREVIGSGATTFGSNRAVIRQSKFRRNLVIPTNISQEWRTPPLWGLRDSAPYLHDGRASTIHDAILLHAGEGLASRKLYAELIEKDQQAVLAFLNTFVAPRSLKE